MKKVLLIAALAACASPAWGDDVPLSDTTPKLIQGVDLSWEFVAEKSGVKVYRRTESDSAILSVKGTGIIEASPDDVFAVLKANMHAHEWMPLVDKRYTLREPDTKSRIEVTLIGMPWPLTDRYVVTLSEVTPQDKGWLIETHSVLSEFSDKSKVEAWMHRSFMTLKEVPGPDGKVATDVNVELHSDPKGSVPSWLVNRFQAQWPHEFIDGLRWFLAKKAGPLGIIP